ncbi:hypothetical protein B9Z55_018468 [Caenorhabditis nigoni]|uniref:Domain of unknown function DB domain-containing protein n=1 Tax=Caenorhabditis nigoni TaxID=1611254 RepID=A0A2G5TE65_9PELO|nr:hypothetical protein B9Z55_018468 [Caenorhabditis nigoni]
MTRFILSAILLVALASSEASGQFTDSCTSDVYAKIKQCYVTYMAGYNLTMTDTIPEYWAFHFARRDLLDADGLHIQPYVCQLGNSLSDCLAPYSCMGPNAYMNMNAANTTEATDYWIDLAVTQYQCGAGYNLTMTEFYCMAFCRDRYQPNIDQCDAQAVIDIGNGMDPCAAQQKDFNCQAAVYRNCCDFNAGVYICNVDLAGSKAVNPACVNAGLVTCPAPR